MENKGAELFIVATPIGNLEDITLRAKRILEEVDIILCEKIAKTRKLLSSYNINGKNLINYGAQNEEKITNKVSRIFNEEIKAALVSEAGTPAFSDPGYIIINYCHRNNIRVTPIPGPCAAVSLLSVAGFPVKNFLFAGYLSNKKIKRENQLRKLLEDNKCTIILYESPYRLKHTLEILLKLDKNLNIVIGREMTKKFEEITRNSVKNMIDYYDNRNIKGELTIIINNNKKSFK